MNGAKIMGGNPANGRVTLDYYATNPEAVKMLLNNHSFSGKKILEPCVGAGHIANVLKDYYGEDINLTAIDIVDRGFVPTIIDNFLEWNSNDKFDTIITNPPYSLAAEFVEKCIGLLKNSGQLAMFLRIQFLEGVNRRELFRKYPPKYVYVFSKRMTVFNNGQELDPKTGKPWATTLCNAWYVWEKGFVGEPRIRWI